MSKLKQQLGVTLLEVILTLAVGSAMVVMGLRSYYAWQNEVALQQIGEQVAFIFDGMRLYYYANCTAGLALGQISTTPVVVLSGSVNLLSPYLTEPVQTSNPLVNHSDSATYYGYIAQFNLHTSAMIPPGNTGTGGAITQYNGDGSTTVGTIVSWTSQVSVEMATTGLVTSAVAALGAECGSLYTGSPATGVYNCANEPGTTPAVPAVYSYTCVLGNYSGNQSGPSTSSTPCDQTFVYVSMGFTIIYENQQNVVQAGTPAIPPPASTFVEFEQTPSYGSGNNTLHSTYMPMLKVFNSQYQHSEYQGFLTGGQNVGSSGSYQTNYYYCGS